MVRHDIGGGLSRPGDVAIYAEISVGVRRFELEAQIIGPVIVEAGQYIGRTELPIVKQIARDLVVAVDADFETGYWQYLLHHTDVEHVGPLRPHRIVPQQSGLLRCALPQRQIGRGGHHLRRRREGSRVAGMERGAIERHPGQADTRAELVGVDILIHLVEAQPCVQDQIIGDLPLVLKISAKQPAGLRAGSDPSGWRIHRTAGHGVESQYGGYIGDQRALRTDGKSEAEGVGVADAPGGIFLDAIDKALTLDIRSHPVDNEVADRVRHEVQLAVAVKRGELEVDVIDRFLVGDDVELVELILMFVERCGIETRHAKGRVVTRLPRIVGNLKRTVRYTAHECQAAGRIDHRRKVEKSFFLRRAVVDCFICRRWIFDPQIAPEVAAGYVVLRLSDRAAVFETRRDRSVAAAIDAGAAAVVEGVRA